MAIPTRSITIIVRYGFILLRTIILPPTAATKHTTEPTDRSMLPPVKIQNSIPVARINTYAFWATRLFTFCGRSITPFVFTENMITTNTRTMTMVYFFNISEKLIFFSIFLLSFT